MNRLVSALALFGCLAVSGCINYRQGVSSTVDLTRSDFSNVQSLSQGEACRWRVLGLLSFNGRQSSIMHAIAKANIKRVYATDRRFESYVVVTRECVIVWGR